MHLIALTYGSKIPLLNMIELFIVLKRDTARNLICLIDISTENIIKIKINFRRTCFKEKKQRKTLFSSEHTHTHAHTRACVRVRAYVCEPVYDQNQQNGL